MWPTSPAAILLLLFLCLTASNGQSGDRRQQSCHSTAVEILVIKAALERILRYLEVKPEELNLDGTAVIRMGQGALMSIRLINDSTKPAASLRELLTRMEHITRRATLRILSDNNSYNRQFWTLVARPFPFTERWRSLKPGVRTDVSLHDMETDMFSFSEVPFDRCYVNLFGTGPNHFRCDIPQDCISAATNSTASRGYSLTHRILYFYFLKRFGCQRTFLSAFSAWTMNLGNYVTSLCRLALQQHETILTASKRRKIDIYLQDLYLEQAVVCGSFGFDNFFRSSNIRLALQWQEKDGCYGVRNEFRSRKLLYERVMRDGCSAHETGLAVAYFGLSLNFLFGKLHEWCPSEFL